LLQYRSIFYNENTRSWKIYSWQYNILSLDFCSNTLHPFATNDKFTSTKHIRNNTINYIITILLFVAITVRSCNKSYYYSNNKKFVVENIFFTTKWVDQCDNEIYLWQYYPHITTIYKFGGNNAYLLQQNFPRSSRIRGNRPIF
jgi:hypothetical protein